MFKVLVFSEISIWRRILDLPRLRIKFDRITAGDVSKHFKPDLDSLTLVHHREQDVLADEGALLEHKVEGPDMLALNFVDGGDELGRGAESDIIAVRVLVPHLKALEDVVPFACEERRERERQDVQDPERPALALHGRERHRFVSRG